MSPHSPAPHSDPRDDNGLVDAINRGDIEAFNALYYRYRDWVVNLAHRLTNDREIALDTLQETFAYVHSKFPGFELRAKFTTFLYPVVKHLAIAKRKKASRHQSLDDTAPDIPDHSSSTDPDSQREQLAQALTSLSKDHREVILLRFVDGFKVDEIASVLKIPSGTVKSRLHHALNQLRNDPVTKKYFNR